MRLARAALLLARAALLLAGFWLVACSESSPDAEVPAQSVTRIVTLAPNLTELVFAVGAENALVGISAYSDYPPRAAMLPVVGDAFNIDMERLALLGPDLLLVWQSGTPAHIVDELRHAGYRVEVVRTRSLEDVATAMLQIGNLTGHEEQAARAVREYRDDLHSLGAGRSDFADIRVFFQVSGRPLYTINGDHYVSELIALCGGRNVFADLGNLAPTVDVEAVIGRDPEVILASSDEGVAAFREWDRWPRIAANRYGNRFLVPADEIARATPRLVTAGRAVCEALAVARAQRLAALARP